MNVAKKRKISTSQFYEKKNVKKTVGIQTAIGPVPLKGTIEVQTQTERSLSVNASVTNNNDICESKWKAVIYKPMPEYIYSPGTITYTQFIHPPIGAASQPTVEPGTQQVFNITNSFSLGHFIDGRFSGVAANSTVNTSDALRDSVFSLDVLKNSTSNVGEAQGSVVKARCNAMFLKSVRYDLQICNLSSNPLIFDIYWCLCMKDSHRDPYTQWQFQLEQERTGQSTADFWTVTNANPVAGKPDIGHYGQKPTTLKGWNDHWKVLTVDHLNVQAGSRCKLDNKIMWNYLAKQNIMESKWQHSGNIDNAEKSNYIAGVTVVAMAVVKGFAIYNENVATATYSGGKWTYMLKQDYSLVPVTIEEKFPYNRIYDSTFREPWNPANEKTLMTQQYTAYQTVSV